jgi:hypothetical protein
MRDFLEDKVESLSQMKSEQLQGRGESGRRLQMGARSFTVCLLTFQRKSDKAAKKSNFAIVKVLQVVI